MENPFSVSFGKAPTNIVNRASELQMISKSFAMASPVSNTYIISGARGVGKTVALSYILEQYRSDPRFVVARLDLGDHMLNQLAAALYDGGKAKKLFLKTEFSFSFQGFGISIKGENPVADVRSLVLRMLEYFKKKGIRVLIAIDDIEKTPEVATFIRSYQGFLIDGFDVCLLMTGLYENVTALEKERSLTFLQRAPKIYLKALPIQNVATSYASIFGIPMAEAATLAKFTRGYAYAYQTLGNILFEQGSTKLTPQVLNEFDFQMRENAYNYIYDNLSEVELAILGAMQEGMTKRAEIQACLDHGKNYFSVYRDRLEKKGILDVSERGLMAFALPRFKEFLEFRSLF